MPSPRASCGTARTPPHRAALRHGRPGTCRLPIDPADIGRTYEEVIRVNSQSGKGGIAHLLRTGHGVDLTAGMRPDFYSAVQRVTDDTGKEQTEDDLWKLFHAVHLALHTTGPYRLEDWDWSTGQGRSAHEFTATVVTPSGRTPARGGGNGPLASLTDALAQAGIAADIVTYSEHATATGPDTRRPPPTRTAASRGRTSGAPAGTPRS